MRVVVFFICANLRHLRIQLASFVTVFTIEDRLVYEQQAKRHIAQAFLHVESVLSNNVAVLSNSRICRGVCAKRLWFSLGA
jgi:hypothetical protein